MTESYHLFGFPIAHSVAPTLHNYLFSRLDLQRTYSLAHMTSVGQRMRALCKNEEFGGASVTMPLKVAVCAMLDRITVEARTIGAVNTIVPERDERGNVQLVGTNTDWLGVRNVLLRALLAPLFFPSLARDLAFSPSTAAALVIGGGGTARAAVYAFASLRCSPIYLVGRDAREIAALVSQFPSVPCVPVRDATSVSSNIILAVSCVPAIAPATPEEHVSDACARSIIASTCSVANTPTKRVFLDMCYKPRTTPLMLHAAGAGWMTVSGIEAFLEQGFAQARMWLAKSVAPDAGAQLIPSIIEEDARTLIRNMPDIVVRSGEEKIPQEQGYDEGRGL